MSDIDVNVYVKTLRQPPIKSLHEKRPPATVIDERSEASITEQFISSYNHETRSAISSERVWGRRHSVDDVQDGDIWEVVEVMNFPGSSLVGRRYRVTKARLSQASDWDTGYRCVLEAL